MTDTAAVTAAIVGLVLGVIVWNVLHGYMKESIRKARKERE